MVDMKMNNITDYIQPFCPTRWCIAIKSIEANYTNTLVLVTGSIIRGQCRRTKNPMVT